MDYYLIAVVVLFGLAISDLVVGVSNDAVNFLNSAVGSKVASRRAILIVASLGIFIGATFSSGMMEIARKGIFHPQHFVLSEIMVIFLAVMLTDILLLDLFNTFGLPTSTTVSIVFELLGAAVVVSLIKIVAAGGGLAELATYINSSKALAIISGIVVSVVIAFAVGAVVQYASRLLFSFRYDRRIRYVGAVWSGAALTAMSYFLVFKGLKGASFVSDAFLGWVQSNALWLLAIVFIVWVAVAQILIARKVNVLRGVVLFGTFALAMAFAGNDLVNFIGVPIAGFESFRAWAGTGTPADQYAMTALTEPVRTNTALLLVAGLVMVATLWLSKKAQSVTDTEVSLGRQDEGLERFSPNTLSQVLVRGARKAVGFVAWLIPTRWQRVAARQFNDAGAQERAHDPDKPAFDLVRASVNLTVASVLIALATSLRLPLSTTYVSFMVAMGTSLADRAWGRESAVYRVSGVLSVIGGWFLTALVAFTISGVFAFLLYQFGGWALAGLVLLVVVAIARTMLLHREREREKAALLELERQREALSYDRARRDVTQRIAEALEAVDDVYAGALAGLFDEDLGALRQAHARTKELQDANALLRSRLPHFIRRSDEEAAEVSRMYLMLYDNTHDIFQSTDLLVEACYDHVRNSLPPLDDEQIDQLSAIARHVRAYLRAIANRVRSGVFDDIDGFLWDKDRLLKGLTALFEQHVDGVKRNAYGRKNSSLFVRTLVESKDLVAIAARFLKYYHRQPAPALAAAEAA